MVLNSIHDLTIGGEQFAFENCLNFRHLYSPKYLHSKDKYDGNLEYLFNRGLFDFESISAQDYRL